jgi:dTDP-4-amino-4,6-dideoxygalactose transaminase
VTTRAIATNAVSVPFLDLRRQYRTTRHEIDDAIRQVIDNTAFVGDPFVGQFERNFANYVGAKHCIGVSSGTSALELTLRALGVGPGDEVIIPANTFIATAEAVVFTGATVVLADVDPQSFNLDPEQVERRITSRTKAVIVVHLYGQPAELDAIAEITRRHNLLLVEDACQAHGASLGDTRIGGHGFPAAFSFYPGKNLGAFGEGGAVTTNDDQLDDKIRLLREHGSRTKYVHEIIGHNHRLPALQAAVLNAKLPFLDSWVKERRRVAKHYSELLAGGSAIAPTEIPGRKHAYHLFVVQVPRRDEVRKALAEVGISTGVHYPIPLHLQPALLSLGYKQGDFPVSEKCASSILSLPMFAELEPGEIEYVAEHLRRICTDFS